MKYSIGLVAIVSFIVSDTLINLALPSFIKAVDAQACGKLRGRREFRMLSAQERTSFINAIRQLQLGPSPTRYDQYVSIHWNARENTHGFAQFFPWHRYFLREFEKDLQRINPSIMIPYWDWTFDSQSPELSPIFSNTFMGGNGWDGCVRTGPFAHWSPAFPMRKCLARTFDRGERLSAYASPEQIMAIMRSANNYHDMRVWIETPPHGIIHSSLGGDMETMYSPNDPIFWLHHAFIDKLWDNWQRLGNGRHFWRYDDLNNDDRPSLLSDRLWPFDARVRDVMDSRRLCYYYEPFLPNRAPLAFSTNATHASWDMTMTDITDALDWEHITEAVMAAPSLHDPKAVMLTVPDNDRSELVALRASKPLPDSWLRMNHQNVTQVRLLEEKLRRVVDRVNHLRNYVSPAALIRHDSALHAIARKLVESPMLARKLTATVGGRLEHIVSVPQLLPPSSNDMVMASSQRVKGTPTNTKYSALSSTYIVSTIRERVEAMTGVSLAGDNTSITSEELQSAAILDN